jgi:3-oxoadipate CoA-transferase beta subunit
MDLAACTAQVWVTMEHITRKGSPRLLERCGLKLTAVRCVTRVFTDIAVVDVTSTGFLVREILAGMSREDLQARSGAKLAFASDCRALEAPVLEESP